MSLTKILRNAEAAAREHIEKCIEVRALGVDRKDVSDEDIRKLTKEEITSASKEVDKTAALVSSVAKTAENVDA